MKSIIPPKGSIPPSIRGALTFSSTVKKRLTVAKERISSKAFTDKLFWLREHLAELEQNGASIEVMEDARAQIERLEELLGRR